MCLVVLPRVWVSVRIRNERSRRRTVKDLKASEPMDFDRERETRTAVVLDLDSGHLRVSQGSDLGSREGVCQYRPSTRAHSRMAFSEAGSAGGGSARRRGSGSGRLRDRVGVAIGTPRRA